MSRFREAQNFRGTLAVLVSVLLLGLVLGTATQGLAESGRKGPEVDDMGELDAAIDETAGKAAKASPPPEDTTPLGAADPDEESLRELEKVIGGDAPAQRDTTAAEPSAKDEKSVLTLEQESAAQRAAADPAAPVDGSTDPLLAPEPVGGPALSVSPIAGPAPKNKLTNLEFKMLGPDSRLTLTSLRALVYREVRNPAMKQVVYYFENTETPERLQRAYDASEFASPVALFTLLQVRGQNPPASKLIVQLREDKVPKVTAHDRGLYIDFPPPSAGSPQVAAARTTRDGLRDDGEESIYSGKQRFYGRRIRKLEVKNSDIHDVLRLIAKSSNYNIVVGDDVTGKVGTLSLENVPWDQAFALVLQSKKLGFVRTGNVLRVSTLETLKQEKDAAVDAERARVKVEPLRTVLIPVSYAKAADLAARGKPFLTEGRGSIETDERTNTVVVKDIDRVVKRIQKLFAALDTQPPRVSIAAKFVEMGTDFTRRIGTNIAQLRPNFSGLNLEFTAPYAGGGRTVTTLNAPQFAELQAALDIGETDNEVRTLANPSVTVVANQQATVSRSFSFFIADQQATPGGVLTQFRQVTTNLTLDVTPLVTGDGSIFLTLDLKNETPKGAGNLTTIDTRSVKTQILLDNGDTAVVGGVFSSQLQKNFDGVPILMRIPIVGSLFSSRSTIDNRSEVFVFITARVTNAEEAFKRTF
jgi:type IV pilus assembly protein PilQ